MPDDGPEVNIRGARAAGAVVIRHRDPSTTVAEVEILFGLSGDRPRPDLPGGGQDAVS